MPFLGSVVSFIRNFQNIFSNGYIIPSAIFKRFEVSLHPHSINIITILYFKCSNECALKSHCGFYIHVPEG